MIPVKLTLINFLSYREATLDFRGLHTACICGANGAGKSSLLEAITWAMWGKTRAVTEDDVIHTGATDVRVDFEFTFAQQTYRVIRTRHKGSAGKLQFQIATDNNGFRALGTKGLKATQEQIYNHINLDYDTFINSAYLRQGKADEFMLLKPNERKDILAKLLKLEQYEELAEKAKDVARGYKVKTELLKETLAQFSSKLPEKPAITLELEQVSTVIAKLQSQQQSTREQLEQLQRVKHEREQLLNQLSVTETRYRDSQQDRHRLSQQRLIAQQEIAELQAFIAQESVIKTNYQTLVALKAREEVLEQKLTRYEKLQQEIQAREKQLQQQRHALELVLQQYQTTLQGYEKDAEKVRQILSNADSVADGLVQLRKHQEHLNQLDRLQQQVTPLAKRRDALKIEIERFKAKSEAELKQLSQLEAQLNQVISEKPQKLQALQEVNEQIQILDNRRNYQARVEEKLQDSHSLIEKLKERIRNLEQQLSELKIKQDSLQQSDAICPLCEQPLDEHHLHQVVSVKAEQQHNIEAQIWSTKEEIAKCTRKRDELIAELNQIKTELTEYDRLQKKDTRLEAELENIQLQYENSKQIKAQIEEIERAIANHSYAPSQTQELERIELQLQNLNYDEKTHSIVREEEKRWRWAENKQRDIEIAQTEQNRLNENIPKLIAQLEQTQHQISELEHNSTFQSQIQQITAAITELDYSRTEHNQVKADLRAASSWEVNYQRLLQAQQDYPRKQESLQTIDHREQEIEAEQKERLEKLTQLQQTLGTMTDNSGEIQTLEQQSQSYIDKLQELSRQQGSLEQSLRQLEEQELQQQETLANLKQIKTKHRVYEELANAFGKKGIQSLMIENILPYLEAQSNHILARLTGNQLHVSFVAQKQNKTSDKTTETLEIIIADSQGTRPYETYSGGEAFRINFAVRLALSKLLAQRAGTSLQLLVIDEGFGTQDQDGCGRLIAAINAIAEDFACILTVTHMQQFKEAFQTHIEVRKTSQGSQLSLSS
ncbi:AAA family ATPase [Gloeocapsa sp. PCC 73106]|uniref:AAA family ATPase n=1 Tax=Gloeocapsa sp. PCC 73106 TaxID=102232 RepID=UPI0002AC3285|nr:AAA family ATPase [Gloeocapsa sp. PCC 73106]ELS00020.1 ATPase involved in DNA repair [Gloeocapsa sp. PCC 73106]